MRLVVLPGNLLSRPRNATRDSKRNHRYDMPMRGNAGLDSRVQPKMLMRSEFLPATERLFTNNSIGRGPVRHCVLEAHDAPEFPGFRGCYGGRARFRV